jgi:hypothetical protein
MIEEKIGDSINYLILLEGLFARKIWVRQGDPNADPHTYTRRLLVDLLIEKTNTPKEESCQA